MPKADLIALQIVESAAKGNLMKAAALALRIDDEAAAAVSKASSEEALALPNQENLRFILMRDTIAGHVGPR